MFAEKGVRRSEELANRHCLERGFLARAVVAREGEEDDEREQHRKSRSSDAEHPRRAIGVREEPAGGRRTAGQGASARSFTATAPAMIVIARSGLMDGTTVFGAGPPDTGF